MSAIDSPLEMAAWLEEWAGGHDENHPAWNTVFLAARMLREQQSKLREALELSELRLKSLSACQTSLREACTIEHSWRSSGFHEKSSPHWICRHCNKAEPKAHDEWHSQSRVVETCRPDHDPEQTAERLTTIAEAGENARAYVAAVEIPVRICGAPLSSSRTKNCLLPEGHAGDHQFSTSPE